MPDCAAVPWAAVILCSLKRSLVDKNPIYTFCLTNFVYDIGMLVNIDTRIYVSVSDKSAEFALWLLIFDICIEHIVSGFGVLRYIRICINYTYQLIHTRYTLFKIHVHFLWKLLISLFYIYSFYITIFGNTFLTGAIKSRYQSICK